MQTLKLYLGAFALCGALLLAQQFASPVPTTTLPASTGSPVQIVLTGTNPLAGAVCGTYNVAYLNWLTGDFATCVNGGLQINPQHVSTNTASNTDTAGFITLVAGAGSYTFTGTYLTAQVCTATDTTAAAAVSASATTTVLTLAGTTTDRLAYTCVKRT